MMVPVSLKEHHIKRIAFIHQSLIFWHFIKCGVQKRIDHFVLVDPSKRCVWSRVFCPSCGMHMIVIIRRSK